MIRYSQLLDVIIANKCTSICEIGTHNGNTAKAMIRAAAYASPEAIISYDGFDLFEDLTIEKAAEEFHGKSNPNNMEDVEDDIISFCDQLNIPLSILLTKGDTVTSLPEGDEKYDIVFVDGGHSIETCSNDIEWALKHGKIVVCDDYYTNRVDVGCKAVVDKRREDFILMPITDVIKDKDLHITMAISPVSAYPWTRFIPLFGHIKQLRPKTVIAAVEDPVVCRHLQILQQMYKFDLVDETSETIDLAIIAHPEAEEIYSLIKDKATSIVIDGVEGDQVNGFSGVACDIFNKDNKTPIYPQSADKYTIAIWPSDGYNVALNVKTRNCVDDSVLRNNISENIGLINKWVVPCKPNNKTAIIVSAGSSLKDPNTISIIKRLEKDKNTLIFCVKHSHDYLIEQGIIPFGCILLDPRDHVKYFINNPNEATKYFVASMCSASTTKALIKRGADIIGYHARVSASLDTLKEFIPEDRLVVIPGGSAASTRAVSLLHCLGFRRFECYCYDLNYAEKPKRQEKTHQGFDKYVKIEASGREFWTDLELIAQANDITAIYENIDRARLNDDWANVSIRFHGDNLGQHVAKTAPRMDFRYTLEDVIKGINDEYGTVPAPGTEKSRFKIVQG